MGEFTYTTLNSNGYGVYCNVRTPKGLFIYILMSYSHVIGHANDMQTNELPSTLMLCHK